MLHEHLELLCQPQVNLTPGHLNGNILLGRAGLEPALEWLHERLSLGKKMELSPGPVAIENTQTLICSHLLKKKDEIRLIIQQALRPYSNTISTNDFLTAVLRQESNCYVLHVLTDPESCRRLRALPSSARMVPAVTICEERA